MTDTKRRRRAGMLAYLAAVVLAGSASAQEAGETQTFGDWTVRCAKRTDVPPCDMVQAVVQDGTQQPVMIMSIGHAGKAEQFGIQIGVPLGILVSGGVLLKIDDKDEIKDLKFTRCLSSGCQIEGRFEPDRLLPMRNGNRGLLAILSADGKPILFPVSFKGFTAAMEAVADKNRAWAKSAG